MSGFEWVINNEGEKGVQCRETGREVYDRRYGYKEKAVAYLDGTGANRMYRRRSISILI